MSSDLYAELEEAQREANETQHGHNENREIAAEIRALRLTIEYQARIQNRALTAIANHLSDLTRLPIKVEADRRETDHAE